MNHAITPFLLKMQMYQVKKNNNNNMQFFSQSTVKRYEYEIQDWLLTID